MYALKRMIAYLIDYAIILTPALAAVGYLQRTFGGVIPLPVRHGPGLLSGGVALVVPALVLGVLTGLTGRTPGKLITFLKVQDFNGDPPGIAEGIVREVVKAIALAFVIGILFALGSVVTNRRTFYDEWLDLDVEDLRPSGLTETQRNFRKFMREKQRRERRGDGARGG
jgi:uncharacterized RDD family membrane protein YckC